jgi:hypothetical protein
MERLQAECRQTAREYLQKWESLEEPSKPYWDRRLQIVREKLDEYDKRA